MAPDQAGHEPVKAEEQAGYSPAAIPGPRIIAYNLREGERPGGIKARWKWRAGTGRKAAVLDARQADVIERILQWQYGRKHKPQP
jgi:hypothetical protein